MYLAADYRRMARQALTGKWGGAILAALIVAVLSGTASVIDVVYRFSMRTDEIRRQLPPAAVNQMMNGACLMCGAMTLYGLFCIIFRRALELGYCQYNVLLLQSETPAVSTVFCRFGRFAKALGLRIVMNAFVWLWSLLLFIPGIIAAYRYAMAPYIMAENPDIGILEAINESKRLMSGHKMRLFCLEFSFIGWILLCGVTLGVGFLWLTPYMSASGAAFYLDLKRIAD